MEATQNPPEFRMLPLAQLAESKTNPRRHFDKAGLEDLTASVRAKGVLVPLLVRLNGKGYELLAGARRYRAATAAGLAEVPVRVVQLTDDEALELQVVENLQREDVHPLDEALGYQALLKRPGYDVENIAAKVGKSTGYVYTRVKLAELTPDAQKRFLEDQIPLSHAMLLARLKPVDQARAMKEHGALFEGEHLAFDPSDRADRRKPRSVREFQEWIDRHVRFEVTAPDPMLFAQTALTLQAAQEQEEKVVHITHEHQVLPEAKEEGKRTYGRMSWKRADGREKSKECDYAVTGVIVVGSGRGEAFRVCISKDKCKTHWGAEQREKAKRASGASKTKDGGEKPWEREQRLQQERYKREEAERQRWKTACPAILAALAEGVKKASTKSDGPLAKLLLDGYSDGLEAAAKPLVPRGKTAEDLVRHVAMVRLCSVSGNLWSAPHELPKVAKGLGVDLAKILKDEAPRAADKPTTTKKKASKKRAA